MPKPNSNATRQAARFASKRQLLGSLVDRDEIEARRIAQLLDANDFDYYVAFLMWLRFCEYVPARFVLPDGRKRVLAWVRGQLRRPELTDDETLGELFWQAQRIRAQWPDACDDWD